ncbi:MAG: uroporphyrinogen decarboxylase family protein [Saccharofermentanales bacterium]
MNSRERIIAAINHKIPDKLPIDFGAMRSTGINILAYDRLRTYLGVKKGLPKLYDIFQQLAQPEMEVVERLGGDVVQAHRMYPSFGISIKDWREETLPNGVHCLVPQDYRPIIKDDKSQEIIHNGKVIAKMPADGNYFDVVGAEMGYIETQEDVEQVKFETISDEELDFIEQEVKDLYFTTDKAVLLCFGGNILEAGETMWGFQKFLEYMLMEPELVHAWLEKLTASYLNDLDKLMPRVAPYINIIQFGDDLGSQMNTLISKSTYIDMIKPYHKMLFQYIRNKYPDIKVFLHSCGAIFDLIPELIDAGVQILNPVQISAAGMDPAKLKREFGKDLVFWGGGANMQNTVLNGSIDDIKKETGELIDIFSEGGGYVFNQVHNIQSNVSPEKIMAIYDTALEKRVKKGGYTL